MPWYLGAVLSFRWGGAHRAGGGALSSRRPPFSLAFAASELLGKTSQGVNLRQGGYPSKTRWSCGQFSFWSVGFVQVVPVVPNLVPTDSRNWL
jgi:hypothetical protein